MDTTESRSRMTNRLYEMPDGKVYDEAEIFMAKRCKPKGAVCSSSSECCAGGGAICSSVTSPKTCFLYAKK